MEKIELFACTACAFTTHTQKGLNIHKRKVHQIINSNARARNRCPSIVQSFQRKLQRNGQSTANKPLYNIYELAAKPYLCAVCYFRTSVKAELKNHMEKTHVMPCPFQPASSSVTGDVRQKNESNMLNSSLSVEQLASTRRSIGSFEALVPTFPVASPLVTPQLIAPPQAFGELPLPQVQQVRQFLTYGLSPPIYGVPYPYQMFGNIDSRTPLSAYGNLYEQNFLNRPNDGTINQIEPNTSGSTGSRAQSSEPSDDANDLRSSKIERVENKPNKIELIKNEIESENEPVERAKSPLIHATLDTSNEETADYKLAKKPQLIAQGPSVSKDTPGNLVWIPPVHDDSTIVSGPNDVRYLSEMCPELLSERQKELVAGFEITESPLREEFLSALGSCRVSRRGEDGSLWRIYCSLCPQKLDSIKAMRQHLRMHIAYSSFKCKNCSLQCLEREEATEHSRYCKCQPDESSGDNL